MKRSIIFILVLNAILIFQFHVSREKIQVSLQDTSKQFIE